MSGACTGPACTCGCCEQGAVPTPAVVFNRPGLPQIDYRIGTYGAFREAMIEGAAHHPALREWTARDDADFGMAFLDCWAYLADILTFYTERAANESFLRTARLRDSVVRLAALLGYRPAPGVAAAARLAFTLDRGHALEVPPGTRVKSVPGPGEQPVTFETTEPLAADAVLNAAPVRGEQIAAAPFDPPTGAPPDGGAVEPPFAGAARAAFRPGTEFLVFATAAVAAEEKRVVSLTERGPVLDLRFAPPAANIDFRHVVPVLSRWSRRFHVFGSDAPTSWLESTVDSSGVVKFSQQTSDHQIPGGDSIQLDRVVEGMQAGVELLLVGPSLVLRTTVAAAGPVAATAGPLRATVTEVTLDDDFYDPSDPDRPSARDVLVYELLGPEIVLWERDYSDVIEGTAILAPVPADPPAIAPGRTVVLDDARRDPFLVEVVGASGATHYGDGPADLLRLDLADPLPRPLDALSAVMYANVAAATHGETVKRERLGSGDANRPFQRVALAKRPLTHVATPGAPHGAAAELEMRVAGLLWHQTETFFAQGPGDRVYVVETADDGTTAIRFGDGETGARPATGAELAAAYRQGLGLAGLVRAGQLTTLLDRPLGLKAVTNPLPASGAADPETRDLARKAAPGSVRALDRVVSLTDFADQALASALVAKARATAILAGAEPGVRLVVAGEGGSDLDADAIAALRADLDARRDPFRRLEISGYVPVPLAVSAAIIARDPDLTPEAIESAARAALLDALAFERRGFGQPLHASDVLAILQGATGVRGVDLDVLGYVDPAAAAAHGAPPDAVLQHVPIADDELGTLAEADLAIEVR
jgi:hypothetical protein